MSDDAYLIPVQAIKDMEGLQKTHFLNDNAARINKSLGDLTGLTGFGFHIIEIEPGHDSTEHHMHHFEDECVYVLSGIATAYIGENPHQIGAGDFIGYRKGGAAHSITNTGTETFRCIVVGERLAYDVGFYTRLGKRIYRNEGVTWNLVDHENIVEIGGGAGKK
ncbi:cupin domain-containing protein [Planktotalea sp.]|uniref:cupin domain-containing protein n=1 Tax=Planktotalea sp. TaxID=2029877 RepID=UPI0025D92086|nr:cupin domain-containing protein [Planktotalea sp.]